MARILVVAETGDEGRGLARILRWDGHRIDLTRTESAARRLMTSKRPELIVLAIADPASALRSLAQSVGTVLRQTPTIGVVPEGAALGGDLDTPGLLDLLPTPFSDESFRARVDALLRVRRVLCPGTIERARLAAESDSVPRLGSAIWRRLIRIAISEVPVRRRERSPLESYLETAASMVGNVEGRDGLDPGHGERVAAHCAEMARALGVTAAKIEMLIYAAAVHDIGKIALSTELLRKPTLTETDRKAVRLHPRRSAELIRALTPYTEAADIVLNHHERPDGQGYYRKRPEDVSPLAKILAVADVFDGMISSRSERPALTLEQAFEALRAARGTYYDADCVDALERSVRPARASVPLSQLQPPTRPH